MLPVALAREVDFGMRDHLLYELARDLSTSLELDVVLEKVMERVITLMKASRGFIVLVDPDNGSMSVRRTGDAVVTTDASLDERFKGHQSVILQNLRSIIAVPLVTKDEVIGAVYVD